MQQFIHNLGLPPLAVVGFITLFGFFAGKGIKYARLPSIIGFMLIGTLLGPSFVGLISESMKGQLGFITDIALGFVAVSIGVELDIKALRKLGSGIVAIILAESLLAFVIVTGAVFLFTKDLPLALIFGAIAPASAPAGTVAVIQEYRASGSLTRALYAVVGFDDGLGIIIFGFTAAIARSILSSAAGNEGANTLLMILTPLKEIGLSIAIGAVLSIVYLLLSRGLTGTRDLFILTFAFVLSTIGISIALHLSLILTNLVMGMVIVNSRGHRLVPTIREDLQHIMPLLFVLFFVLAGANLHVAALPSLGILGIIYIFSRAAGLMGGSWFGAVVGRVEAKIRKYVGLGILSQAGVAIGLALIVKQEFSHISTWGAEIGATVITTITATCIIFEIIGPITCRIGLKRAGEIPSPQPERPA